ncbi:testis-expressed protein 19 [Molossus nigricans]
MCPPVSVRSSREGMSHLYAAWLYQLQHGAQLRICFACFKLAFLSLKEFLESEGWEDEDGDPQLMEFPWLGPEEGPPLEMGLSWWQDLGQPEQGGFSDLGSDTVLSDSDESEEVSLDQYFVPTELNPQNAAPLSLGPEDADWTQGLPWRFGGVPACNHWPSPYFQWQRFFEEVLPPGEPMLLELSTTREMDPVEAEAWLLDLQLLSMVGVSDAAYLRNMTARWVLRTSGQCWEVLLDPDDACVVRVQSERQGQDLTQWELSILETSSTGYGVELVPADTALLRRGFSILSYSPWDENEAEEDNSTFEFSNHEEGPDITVTSSSEPREAGESLGPGGAALFPAPLPKAPEMRD